MKFTHCSIHEQTIVAKKLIPEIFDVVQDVIILVHINR